MRYLIILSLILSSFGRVAAEEPHFLSHPTLSPDGKAVVFCFEGDLWQADIGTGDAFRLTAMEGYETSPRFSPDGKWLAFTGSQFGNGDVYVIPTGGGDIRQLTFHAANDQVDGWTWDSKEIIMTSSRLNSVTGYRLPVTGGNPVRMFDHYFNTIHNIAIHPKTGVIFFNDTWESSNMAHRKRYRGEYDPDIQSYDPKTKEHKIFTTWAGKDMWTTIDQNGTVYFVSDQQNGQYNLYKLDGDQPVALTKFKTSIKHPSVSADGSLVVFEKDYQLYLYDPQKDKTKKLEITILRNPVLPKEHAYNVSGKVSGFDISPDQKKIAFISRGDLFVSDIKGKFIRMIDRGGESFERVMDVHWLKDNKTLLISQTWNGYANWFTLAADGSGELKQLTQDLRNNRSMVFNKERSQGVYLSGRDELRLMDLKTFKSKVLVTDEFWGFQNSTPEISPDGKWVLFGAKRDFEDDIFVYNLETEETLNLSGTGVSESGAKWGPEGKYIYFVSSLTHPSYPRGGGDRNLYRMAMDWFSDPFRGENWDQLFVEDSTKKKKDSIPPVEINPDRIWERIERIGPSFGTQGSPTLMKKGDQVIVLYSSNHDQGSSAIWMTTLEPFERAKTEKITGLSGYASLMTIKDKLYAVSGGDLYTINIASKKATKINLSQAFTRDLAGEFKQMFEQTWANIEENFYHDDLHGEDWEGHRDYYAQFLPFLNNRGDLRTLLNDMLGELNSSHMGFNTRGDDEKINLSYQTVEPGILFTEADPYVVERVVTRGPADRKEVDIQPGDRLIAVDGKTVDPDQPRDLYFYRPAMVQELSLTFDRGGLVKEVNIHPGSYRTLTGCLYDEWIDENRERVNKLSNNEIAYAHMKNMGSGELNKFLITMARELNGKKGLILDLRYNTGGNVHDDVLRFLQQKTYLQWKARGGTLSNQSNFAPSDHPIVLLINEQSLSDAEMTSAGFKELGLGTIIGTESYRWIIFTSGMGLVDGSSHRMPGWGCYTLDGKNLEKEGVKPDMYVKQTFTDRLEGKDPQIEAAVKHILK